MSVNEAAAGLVKQIEKTYAVFAIGIAVAVTAAAQIRFASLGPEWMPDAARRAYVEGLVVTGTALLWIAVTLIAGVIARVALPALLTLAVTFVILAYQHGTLDQEFARMLFDSSAFGTYLGDVGQVVIGPILLAPAIGSLGARDLWQLLGRVPRSVRIAAVRVGAPVLALVVSDVAYASHLADEITEAEIVVQLPRSDSSWRVVPGTVEIDHVEGAQALGMYLARRDFTGIYGWSTVGTTGADPHADDPATVHYTVQNGEARFAVFIDQYRGIHPWPLDDRAEDDSALVADLQSDLESADVDELTRANCWACPG
ncbi:hypothetical protein ABTZ46_24250 [Nocardioides sp. NPDC126508]